VTAGQTRIELCGAVAVRWLGEPLDDALRRRQSRLLFAFLVLNRRRAVRRDELVAAVWAGEDVPARAEELLSPLLSRLRKALGAEWIEGRRELTLRLPEGATVDWEDVHDALDEARRHADEAAWRVALEAARRAASIAATGLLPGDDAPWIEERRAELAELRVAALELEAQAATAVGGTELAGGVSAARAAVQAAPFRESCWARLIEALRAEGNPAEALRAFDELRDLLSEELGASPSWEVAALRESLLHDAAAPPTAAAPPIPDAPLTAAAPPIPDAPRTAAAPPAAAVAPPAAPPMPDAPPAGEGPVPPRRSAPRLPGPAGLVERERELDTLDGLITALPLGEGRVALIEGPAGLGKTRLLDEARRRAADAGATVLSARAGELERDFPFGVVRQLLEVELGDPARREQVLAGAAAPAAAVFGRPTAGESEDGASFAVLHGLYWALVHLSSDRPLVLAVDDVHWADRPSLRLLAYLVRRLEGLPVLLAATLRTGEQPTDAALLDEIVLDPATVSIRPGPLSVQAAEEVVRARLGARATAAFCAACRETTSGNPLLLHQLLAALEAERVEPVDDNVGHVHDIGARAVSRTIGLRLARMPPGAVAAGRAVAVLGEGAELPAIAALARLDVDAAARAVADLARAEILRSESPLGFVHPLVRDALYSGIPVGERELQHGRAARLLAEAGAEPEQVALQLVKAPPTGDPEAVRALEEAGSAAVRKGAPDSAAAFLRRALAEPPPPDRRPALLLELGLAEQLVDGAAAAEHLARAHASLEDPAARGRAALALGETLFFAAPPPETLDFVRAARRETPDELDDVKLALEAYEMMTLIRGGVGESVLDERLDEYERDGLPEGESAGYRMLESIVAWGWAFAGRDAIVCADLALRSLRGGTLAEVDDGMLIPGPMITLTIADRPETLPEWDRILDAAYRRGSLLLTSTVHIWRGHTLLLRGDLQDAERSLRESLAELSLWGSGGAISVFPMAFLALALVERGDLEGARRLVAAAQPPEGSQGHFFLLWAEAELALAEGRPRDALRAARRLHGFLGDGANPGWVPVHDLLARSLAGTGAPDEARAAALRGVELAEEWGAPAFAGRALRTLGEVTGDRATLEQAVAVLEGSQSRLERAKALAAVGTAQIAAGEVEAAAPALGAALTLAGVCGAGALAARIVDAHALTGVAPGGATSGIQALTALESRVAALVDEGCDARQIAERLHLTPGEAAAYLARAREKLGGSALTAP
jgi:DNA-binding SARP family transcriptional activator/tetratricopeptide (TPR) repeat protein/DNA-binding CsgD family transcriptional regulator